MTISRARSARGASSSSSTRSDDPASSSLTTIGIRDGTERLLGFQISGESRTGAPHGWKSFDVEQMHQVRVLNRRFAGTRSDSAQHHRVWDALFARVS